MLDNEKFKALIGISENYEMPEKLMKILENQEERESMFTILADQETDMSYDWFTDVYQQEHGDRDALNWISHHCVLQSALQDSLERTAAGMRIFVPEPEG